MVPGSDDRSKAQMAVEQDPRLLMAIRTIVRAKGEFTSDCV